MTKKEALDVLKAPGAQVPCPEHDVELLDRAGAFPSEESAAEINIQARTIIADGAVERGGTAFTPRHWRTAALRLATACRNAGLVRS